MILPDKLSAKKNEPELVLIAHGGRRCQAATATSFDLEIEDRDRLRTPAFLTGLVSEIGPCRRPVDAAFENDDARALRFFGLMQIPACSARARPSRLHRTKTLLVETPIFSAVSSNPSLAPSSPPTCRRATGTSTSGSDDTCRTWRKPDGAVCSTHTERTAASLAQDVVSVALAEESSVLQALFGLLALGPPA